MTLQTTKRRVGKSTADRLFDLLIYTICTLLILVTLYPMYFILIASFSDPTLVSNGQITFLPKGINLKAYRELFSYQRLWMGYGNTILYVIGGTLMSLAVNIPAAFALSRKRLFGKKLFTTFFLIPMFFHGRADPHLPDHPAVWAGEHALGHDHPLLRGDLLHYCGAHLLCDQHPR